MVELSRRQFIQITSTVGLTVGGLPLPAQPSPSDEMRLRWGWRLRVGGEVARPCLHNLEDVFRSLPSRLATLRLVEASGEEVMTRWQGLHLSTLLTLARPAREAGWVNLHCADGHRASFPVAELLRPRALLAHTANERLLDAAEGGPIRLILPWRSSVQCPGAIERIEFSREPGSRPDETGPLLSGGERTVRGWRDEGVGVPALPDAQSSLTLRSAWRTIANPEPGDWQGDPSLALLRLQDPSFHLASGVRTRLVMQGPEVLPAMMPDQPHSPLHSTEVFARLCVANIAGEIDHPAADSLALSCLGDPSPEVAGLALDICARRGLPAGREWARRWVESPHGGLATTALSALDRLCSRGDPLPAEVSRGCLERSPAMRAEALRILAERS